MQDISSLYELDGEYGRFIASRFDSIYLTPIIGRLAYNILMAAGTHQMDIKIERTGVSRAKAFRRFRK